MACDKEILNVSELRYIFKHYFEDDDELAKMEFIDTLVRDEDLINNDKTYEENMLKRLKLIKAVINGFKLTEE